MVLFYQFVFLCCINSGSSNSSYITIAVLVSTSSIDIVYIVAYLDSRHKKSRVNFPLLWKKERKKKRKEWGRREERREKTLKLNKRQIHEKI